MSDIDVFNLVECIEDILNELHPNIIGSQTASELVNKLETIKWKLAYEMQESANNPKSGGKG